MSESGDVSIVRLDLQKVSENLTDFAPMMIMASILIPTFHMVLHRYVITPVGTKWLGILDAKKTDDEQTALQRKLVKFQESAWKFILYCCLIAASFYALSGETFWWPSRITDVWRGCGGTLPCAYPASTAMTWAFALQLSYYVYAAGLLLFFEKPKKDHWAMVTHHAATLILIGYCFILGWKKGGLVVMVLHDVSDPLLEGAKIAIYAGKKNLTDAIFVCFMLVWLVMRTFFLPFCVLRTLLFECPHIVVGEGSRPAAPHWEIIAGGHVLLQCLHIYWTYFILKIAYKAVVTGDTEDDREEDDD